MITNHGYSFSRLRADYIRAFVGLTICLAPSLSGAETVGGVLLLLGLAVIFAIYGLSTIFRQITRVMVNEDEILMKALTSKKIPWNKLSEFSLAYFTTWRKGGTGWMQLKLRGNGKTLRIESSVTEFDTLVKRALDAAAQNHVELNSATLRNLEALEITPPVVGQAA